MADQQPKSVADFVLNALSKDYLAALTILAGLQFELTDRASFLTQVNAYVESNKSCKAVVALLTTTLGDLDFPIKTSQGAMEKFHFKAILGPLEYDPPFFRRAPPSFDPGPIERPERHLRRELLNTYGLECGLEAYDVYLAYPREHFSSQEAADATAEFFARREGDKCLRTRGLRLPPWWPWHS
jgi:hypothetical protein